MAQAEQQNLSHLREIERTRELTDESTVSDGYQGYGYYKYGRYTSRYASGKKRTSKSKSDERPTVVSGQSRLNQSSGNQVDSLTRASSISSDESQTTDEILRANSED